MGRESALKLVLGIAGILGVIFFIRIALESSRKIFTKTIITYTLVFLLLVAATRALNYLNINNARINFSLYQLIFLLMGILHCYLIVTRFFKGSSKAFLMGLIYTISITIIGGLALIFVFQFTDQLQENFLIASSLLIFPLPYIIYYTFYYGNSIPTPIYNTWSWPDEPPDIDDYPEDDSFLLSLVVTPSSRGLRTKEIICRGPVNFKFGDFFYAAVAEYNERDNVTQKVEVLDEEQQPYGWMFFEKSNSFWKKDRMIDFDLSIYYNDLGDKSHIICKRVKNM